MKELCIDWSTLLGHRVLIGKSKRIWTVNESFSVIVSKEGLDETKVPMVELVSWKSRNIHKKDLRTIAFSPKKIPIKKEGDLGLRIFYGANKSILVLFNRQEEVAFPA